MVFPDGAVTRKTRVVTDQGAKFGVETRYILPPDGKWSSGRRMKRLSDGNEEVVARSIYEVEKQYAPGSPIASDYVRKAKFSKEVSRNEPRLTVRNYVFVKTFDYEERFRDIITQESFEQTVRKIYAGVIEHTARYLAQERQDGLTAAQARTAIASAFDPLLEKSLHTARSEGIRAAGAALEKGHVLGKVLEPEQVAARVIGVLPPATGQDSESWRKAIAEGYNKALDAVFNKEDPAFEEEIWGVYGFGLFGPRYGFKVALSLPGELLENNATRQDENRLVWVFRSDDFLYDDHVLRAGSRLIYPERIAVAGAAIAAILAVLMFVRLRTRRNRTGSSQRGPV